MYISFINDRKDLGFMCLKDKEAGDQVSVILVIGIISIRIYLRFVSDEDLVDRLYSTRPSCERVLKSKSSNSTQQVDQVHNCVEEKILVTNTDGKVIKTGSGILIGTQPISEGSKSALTIRSGDLGKSGPDARAKADARRNVKAGKYSSGRTIFPGADAFVQHSTTFCHYHDNAPLSCKPKAKVSDGPFQNDGDNNQPPPESGNFDASKYRGGPNPFIDTFDYDNPKHTRENTDFSSQKRLNHAYDRHAEKCFLMKENRNKITLETFKGNARRLIESPNTERSNGSYRYETPVYFYKDKTSDLLAIVNATDNSFITVVNTTEFQLQNIRDNHNFGLDTRPSMQLSLGLRGPKNHN